MLLQEILLKDYRYVINSFNSKLKQTDFINNEIYKDKVSIYSDVRNYSTLIISLHTKNDKNILLRETILFRITNIYEENKYVINNRLNMRIESLSMTSFQEKIDSYLDDVIKILINEVNDNNILYRQLNCNIPILDNEQFFKNLDVNLKEDFNKYSKFLIEYSKYINFDDKYSYILKANDFDLL